MRATSLIQALLPSVDGRVMFESFEGLNWQTDQSWQIINGTPVSSSNAAEEGLKSLILDSTFPHIYNAKEFELCVGYFYDDSSETTGGIKPFLRCRVKGTANFYGLGVDNSVSTTHYCKNVAGVITATSIARTTAWHRFAIMKSGTAVVLIVDTSTEHTAAGAATDVFDRVEVGCTVYAGTHFGYFDYIQLADSKDIEVKGLSPGQKVSFYKEDDTQIGSTVTVTVDSASFSVEAEDFPLSSYFKITRTDGTNPRFRSPLLKAWAGDDYILYEVDFSRKVTAPEPIRIVKLENKESNSGKNEGIFFHARETCRVAWEHITDEQMQSLLTWWSYAQQSKVYSVAIDSNQMYDGRLSAAATAYATGVTVVDAAGLQAGAWCILKRTDNVRADFVQIASVSGTTVTFNGNINYSYRVGDILRSIYYFPFVINTDNQLNTRLVNQKAKRWTFMHSFKESL